MANKSLTQLSVSVSEYDVVEDLSTWEFINPSDDENDAVFAFTDSESDDDAIGSSTSSSSSPPSLNYLMALNVHVVDTQFKSTDVDKQEFRFNHQIAEEEKKGQFGKFDHFDSFDNDDEYSDDDEEDDLDDELVPMSVRGKFGKQRIKKLGKRGGPRMNKSKKLAYIFNRPGCVRGLGVQHSYI